VIILEPLQWVFLILLLLLVIYGITRLVTWPLRLLWKLIYNSLLGLVLLLVTNLLGNFLGITLPVNWLTILVAGFLGLPGILLLIILNLWL